MNDLIIEWDDNKAKANELKHKIKFSDAVYVFQDINRIEIYDEENSIFEDRYITIGKVGTILFVVYTAKSNTIRIISARKANSIERNYYYDNLNNKI